MYFYPDIAAKVASKLGIRALISGSIQALGTGWAKTETEALEKNEQLLQRYQNQKNPLVQIGIAPHSIYGLSQTALLKCVDMAKRYDSLIHIHVQETKQEIKDSLKKNKKRPIEFLLEIGILNPKTLAVHLTQLNPRDIECLIKSGCHAVHCPVSNLKLASGLCPTQALIDAGINVTLGTDGAASNNTLDILKEAQYAALLAKGTSLNPEALTAKTALEMGTINSAHALGLEDRIGSIMIGKSADLIAIDFNQLNTKPCYDIFSHLIYCASSKQITDVWIEGIQKLKNRELLCLDELELLSLARQWQTRLSSK